MSQLRAALQKLGFAESGILSLLPWRFSVPRPGSFGVNLHERETTDELRISFSLLGCTSGPSDVHLTPSPS